MSVGVIKKLHINSIVLDSNSENALSIFGALQISPGSYKGSSDLAKTRARIIISYNPKTSQIMDFLTQRFNEYDKVSLENPQFRGKVTPPQYVSFLKGDLNTDNIGDSCHDMTDFLKESSPISPFSSKKSIIETTFKDRVVYEGDGDLLPLGMTMCDAPVESLITAQAAKELIKRSKNNTKNDHVYMKPLQMKFENLKLKDIKNLSVYAYVYKMPSGKGTNLQISLSTGMTSVTSNTLMGVKTTWDSISVNNPFLGIGTKDKSGNYKGKNTSDSPSKDKLIDFNLLYDPDLVFQNMMDISDKLSATSNSYIIDDTTSELSKQGGSNYFSNLWMTKDSDENRRFAFAFDLGAYLAANSLFPYLYKNPVTALQILDGTGTMQMQRPSQVLSMNVGRVFVDPFSLLPINQLGTSGYSTELGPDFDFPFKDVGAAHRIEKIAIPSIESVMGTRLAKNSISFYEGKDHLDKIRQPNHYNKGTFRYSVEFSVYDASLVYLRTLLSNLVDQKTLLDNLYENITRSPYTELGNPDNTQASEGLNVVDFAQRKIDLVYNYYSPETGYLNGDPSKINVPLGMGSVFENKTIKEYLDSSLAFYEEVLNSLSEDKTVSLEYFYKKFSSPQLEVQIIQELIHNMNVFIHLLYRRVSEVLPSDPLGRDAPSSERVEFLSRGLMEYRAPIFRGSYSFDHKEEVGKDYGFGVDSILDKEQDEGRHNGLSRVPYDLYENRTAQELAKYFSADNLVPNSTPSDLLQTLVPLIGEGSYRFFTPYIIRIPRKKSVIQPTEIKESVYPLSSYAQLFTDVFEHKTSLHPGGLYDPLVFNFHNPQTTPNEKLYNSVASLLREHHQTELIDNPIIDYPPLDVNTGEQPLSTDLDIYRFFPEGPLAIPSIVGGSRDLGTVQKNYLNTVDTLISNEYDDKKPIYETQSDKKIKNLQRPIKLPFAIFGELSVDPEINLAVTYQEKLLNSIKSFANQMGYSNHNVEEIFDQDKENVPPSIKSLLVIGATDTRQSLFQAGLDSIRPVLEDKDADEVSKSIAVEIFGEGEALQETGDPMKIYAKFMAFWMNYKQVSIIEYLSGFENLAKLEGSENDPTRNNKLKLPVWRPINSNILSGVRQSGLKVMCRARVYNLADYLKEMSPHYKPFPEMDYQQRVYDFPVYNKYFFLDTTMIEDNEITESQFTTEDECHIHTYTIDDKGNGWTSEAINPDNPKVRHKHQIINYQVQSSMSHCYPNCEKEYGTSGVGPHVHKLTVTTQTQSTALDGQNMTQVTMTDVGEAY